MAFALCFSRPDYEYDIYGLIRAFYPGMELEIREAADPARHEGSFTLLYRERDARFAWDLPEAKGSAETPVTDWADRFQTKNELKRMVYRELRGLTGRDLPWGGLTGIRPVKLARWRLEAGDDRAAAVSHMREQYYTSEKKAALAVDIAARELDLTGDLPLEDGYSLYVGIPFCPSICLYCTFGSHPITQWKDSVGAYLATLKEELAFLAQEMPGAPSTVYVGGGTPTSLSAEELDDLLSCIRREFDFHRVREFTVEAGRPDTVTEERLAALRENGVTRVSINPQTMHQATLDRIGRAHTVEQTESAFALARRMGFANINMDMIVGLPGEGGEEVTATLRRIEALAPDSLTVHSLAMKRAARLRLFREEYEGDSFRNSEEIMDAAAATAGRLGLRPYYLYRQKDMAGNFENVGYAAPGKEGLYNILIMEELQSIVGAGSGATTKFVHARGRATDRVENVKNIREYIERFPEMIERKRAGIRRNIGKENRDDTE